MTIVTIAIPTMNRAEYLRLALQSALRQTHEGLEVLVADNASTDHTPQVLASFSHDSRLRVFRHHATLSMVENWNSCISAAMGEYFLMLSDDDLLDPDAISAMVACFEYDKAVAERTGMVYCRGRMIDETGKQLLIGPPAPPNETARELILNFFRSQRLTWACTILFRTSDIREGYLQQFPLATDAALWMRTVTARGEAMFVNRVLASYRVHQNITAKTPPVTWQRENTRLARYAVNLLREAHRLREGEGSSVLEACAQLNIRLVTNLVNQNHRRRRLAGLKVYLQHWREFATVYGVFYAAKGILQLLLPGLSSSIGRIRNQFRPTNA